mgnify:CR=1 FL=1
MDYISMSSSEDVIEHFGIKGMRWGIRSRHSGLSSSWSKYKDTKKKNKRDISGGYFGKHDYLHDKAVRSLARKKAAEHAYKAERDSALLKDRMNMHKRKSMDYENVYKKYQSHMHNDKNHKGHYYKDVDKSNLSGLEKHVNDKVSKRGRNLKIANAVGTSAAMAGLLAGAASPEIARYLINRRK